MILSSLVEASSLLHSIHKDTRRAAATMPKQTKSYQYTTSAIYSHTHFSHNLELGDRNVRGKS